MTVWQIIVAIWLPLPFVVIGLLALERWMVGKVRRRRMRRAATRGLTAKDREWVQKIGGSL